jgi:hypothetical protein
MYYNMTGEGTSNFPHGLFPFKLCNSSKFDNFTKNAYRWSSFVDKGFQPAISYLNRLWISIYPIPSSPWGRFSDYSATGK